MLTKIKASKSILSFSPIVLSKEQAEWIKHMVIKMSTQEGRQITVSEAVRIAIETAYPLPKNQMKLLNL